MGVSTVGFALGSLFGRTQKHLPERSRKECILDGPRVIPGVNVIDLIGRNAGQFNVPVVTPLNDLFTFLRMEDVFILKCFSEQPSCIIRHCVI